MKKLLTILTILLTALTTAWAGEQTITISRNDGQYNSAQGVYYVSKGGVTMTMSGGMNNKNYLVLRNNNTLSFKSANFPIKKIIFHCLDNFESDNLDVFFWGPTTMNVMPVRYKPAGSSTTTEVTPGKFTASGYDGTWTSNFSGTWTSVFRNTEGNGTETRTHTSFPNGWPAGNSLIFGSLGKPIRFSSIDIVVEKEDGDIYDLVTNVNQIVNQHNYLIVNWPSSVALSVNTKEGKNSKDVHTGSPVTFIEGHVDDSGLYNQYAKVKTDGEAQIIKFERHTLPISNASGEINTDRPWTFNAGGNYLRIYSSAATEVTNDNGPDLYLESAIDPEWSYAAIFLGNQSYGYNARIRFRKMSSTSFPRPTDTDYRIGYNADKNYFRDLYYGNGNAVIEEQNIRLYTPSRNYNVTTEVQPDASKGSIALRDGVIVNNASATSGTSQQFEVVSFLVTPANGYKIGNLVIQALNTDGTVASTIEPQSSVQTTSGTLYTFVMPANDVNIVATFAEVEYHNVNIVVKPNILCGNVFLTEGYVVQNDQVKSYDGQNVVFNVTPNPINPADESEGYYELSYVTITDNTTGVENTLTADNQGNYTFTMPDNEVTITAYFYDNTKSPLWLLGTANGETQWHTYGPRFNYDNETDEYYIDVYFKGTGEYDSQNGEAFGRFSVTWKIDLNDDWAKINNQNLRGVPGEPDYLVNENSENVYLWYGSEYENNSYKIPAGVYRIYVGTTASQNKGNLNNNQLKIEKYTTTLTFDPAGGASANEAVEVPLGQGIILAGDLYNKIKAINPNEADANFKYKYDRSIDGTSYTGDPTTESAGVSTTATLTEANEVSSVTKLEAHNYLGWIVADNTAYYKVIETPLEWIEVNGTPGENYTVSNELLAVYRANNSLWCKDMFPYKSYAYHTPFTPDYMVDFAEQGRARVGYDNDNSIWDQSNWVELDFSNLENGASIADDLKGKKLAAGTVKGVYSKPNHKIVLTSAPTEGQALAYVPNSFCPVNFLDKNIDNDGAAGANNTNFFFVNPKVQEYAVVTMAVWVGDNKFVVPAYQQNGEVNGNDFDGAFNVNWTLNNWDCFNEDCPQDQSGKLNQAESDNGTQAYQFHAIIRVPESSKANGPARINVTPKPDQTPSDNYMIFPLDLIVNSDHIITAVSRLDTAKAVQSVTYSDLAGRTSSKPFAGVNIVITRYTDGTVITSKQVR